MCSCDWGCGCAWGCLLCVTNVYARLRIYLSGRCMNVFWEYLALGVMEAGEIEEGAVSCNIIYGKMDGYEGHGLFWGNGYDSRE